MTEAPGLAPVTEARRRGVRVVWDPPRYRGAPEALALVKTVPDTAREVLRRAALFRQQLDAWTGVGRWGVPLLVLPEAPVARLDACHSCGTAIPEARWRCALCCEALELALGLSPPNPGGSP